MVDALSPCSVTMYSLAPDSRSCEPDPERSPSDIVIVEGFEDLLTLSPQPAGSTAQFPLPALNSDVPVLGKRGFDHSATNTFSAGKRRKAPIAASLTLEALCSVFHLPLKKATEELGACDSYVKNACRAHGIKRW